MERMNINKKLFIYIIIIIIFLLLIFISLEKKDNLEDIEIVSLISSNIKLNNIKKDNYLLIDPSYLNKSNEIILTIKNNSYKYDFYINLECDNIDSYQVYSNINHYYIKSNSSIISSVIIDKLDDINEEFIKCYIKNEIN